VLAVLGSGVPQPSLIPSPAGPLRGVRVIEFCEGVAGPHAAWLLAELGCDVVKLEHPAGDRLRGSPAFHVLNRSKRSVRLAAPADAAAEQVATLVRRADVLLVDRELARALEPAVAAALDPASLAREHPRLVHCTVSGFGERGPLADLPPDDGLVSAASGISAMQWSHGGGPTYLTTPLTAYGCGMMTALAVAAALRARLVDGLGQQVHTSQLAAALLLQSGTYVTGPRSKGSLVASANDPHGIMPTYAFYQASDDWLFVGALTETFWARLCLTIERPDLLEDPTLQGTPMAFAAPPERRLRVRRTLEEAFARAPREEWLARLSENDVPAGPILDRTTFLRDEGTRAAGMHVVLDDPDLGATEQPGVALRFARTPGAIRGPAAALGAHDDEVRREWCTAQATAAPPARRVDAREEAARARARALRGWSDDPAHPRNASRAALPPAPLDGVRVLSFATFIAGALCPMLLADLGAEVIKLEPLGGDPFRPGTVFGFLGWNRGTRSLAVDAQREEGRDLVLRLVERADLVVDNFRCGVLERLGLDFPALERVNPRVVQLSISGYGPDGPLAHLPCFDPIMQGRSGLARAQSGFDPTMYTVAYTDYATATMAALAAVAGLLARDTPGASDGRGQAAWTSLLNNACVMQAGFLIEYPGKPADAPGAIDLRGASAWRRAYACADGWLFVAATSDGERRALLRRLGVDERHLEQGDGERVEGATAGAIAAVLATHEVTPALARLRDARVPAVACPTFPGIVADEHLRANELWWSSSHPELGEVVQTGEVIKLSRTRMRLGPTAPRLGEHSCEVLREAGIDEATIERLLAAGVVRQAEDAEEGRS
jgi:crotonobetainyl-CoA:carnitine CoA-transferase CaiB-like acyl-CoA transferase